MFLKILSTECDVGNFKDEEIDEILKQKGVHDLKKINSNHLKNFLKSYFENQMEKYK